MESTRGLVRAAEKHLELLADDPDHTESLDKYYVVHAFGYGVEIDRISELSGIPVPRVRSLLVGA